MNFKSVLGSLRIIALLEGISYLSFLITMPLKYMFQIGLPNKIVGNLHGVLFIAYVFFVFWASMESKWNLKTKFWAYLASMLPFATFIVDAKIFKPTQSNPSHSL